MTRLAFLLALLAAACASGEVELYDPQTGETVTCEGPPGTTQSRCVEYYRARGYRGGAPATGNPMDTN